jgi:hypothetical protein
MIICAKYIDTEHVSYLAVDDWQQALDIALRKPSQLLSLLLLAEGDILPDPDPEP